MQAPPPRDAAISMLTYFSLHRFLGPEIVVAIIFSVNVQPRECFLVLPSSAGGFPPRLSAILGFAFDYGLVG